MSKPNHQLMGLSGAAFTGIGSSIGVALVAYVGFVIASAGKASIISILIGLLIGLSVGVPTYFLSKRMVIKGSINEILELGLGKSSSAFYAYTTVISLAFFSTYPVSIASYIVSVFPVLAPYQQIVSMIILVISVASLCFGVKLFENVSKLFTVLLLFNLTLFVVLGLVNIGKNGINPFDFTGDPIYSESGIDGILAGVPLFAGTCTGFVNIAFMGPVVSEPKKNVPKAIIASSFTMVFFWIFLTIVAANVLPVQEVAGKPLTFVARALMPEWLAMFFALTGPTMAIWTTYIPGMQISAVSIGRTASQGLLPKFLRPKNSNGIDRYLILVIGAVCVVINLFNLPVNVIVSSIAPSTSFGMFLRVLAHVGIAFKHKELFDTKKDWNIFLVFSIIGTIGALILFIISIRAITVTMALINIAVIVGSFGFAAWKTKKDEKAAQA